MAIESSCSGCGKQLSVADEHAGRQARCPACGQIYTVPLPNTFDASAGATTGPNSASPPSTDLFSDTSMGMPPPNPSPSGPSPQFWMQAPDGNVYGPVDRNNLTRWFQEGRVGPQYMIRQGEDGPWQGAELFQPQATAGVGMPGFAPSSTPLGSSPNPYAPAGGQLYRYPKSDQSTLVLVMGIVGFFFCPCAIAAWIMGHGALRDINAGLADPTNKGLVQVGYYLGIGVVAMNLLCFGGYMVLVAVVVASGGNM
jgi:hypothetical protein